MNAIQRGRFYLISHIGKLMPAEKPGGKPDRGKSKSKAALPLLLSKPTLSAYRKVAKRRVGSLVKEMQDAGKVAKQGDNQHTTSGPDTPSVPLTLSELGLTHQQSSRRREHLLFC